MFDKATIRTESKKINTVSKIFGIISITLPFLLIPVALMTSMVSLYLLGTFGKGTTINMIPTYCFKAFITLCVSFAISGVIIGIISLKKGNRSAPYLALSWVSTVLLLLETFVMYYAGTHY